MKRKVLAVFTIVQLAMSPSWSQSIDNHVKGLANAHNFALGQVGFVGHISQAEQHYRAILQSADALALFKQMLASQVVSIEARLYAACGIRQLASDEFDSLTHALKESGISASVLRADILQKEPVSLLLSRIERFGCVAPSLEHPDTPTR